MKTERSKAEVVFKDMNTANVPTRQALKKSAPAIKTEAFGDKENALEKTHVAIGENELMKSKVVEQPVCETKDAVKRPTTHIESVGEKKINDNLLCEDKIHITADDLTNPAGPSENYWKVVAEQRRKALEETLIENRMVHQKCALLEAENTTLKQALQEATEVINLLNEIVAEENSEESAETQCQEKTEDSTCVENSPVKVEPKNDEGAFGNDSTVYESDDSDKE